MKEEKRHLWAPWRIDFIRSKKEEECFLCIDKDSKENDLKNLIIYRAKHSFIILNRYPYNSGHLLIAPYRHIGDIELLKKEELHELMDLTVFAKRLLCDIMQPDAFNIGFNLGTAAGAGVSDHIHMHIVPRWNGDTNFMPVIADTDVVPEALEATAKLMREKLA